uniref:PID domain-containing protein n=1 Tax=Neogobius melanostomus TaxID=47308 RepID=A0A8C6T369_9GOBI
YTLFPFISETTDYVAYVAKDPVNRRACHILECADGLAQDVISTIGQAFDLRFQQYLRCPSKLPWTEEEDEAADHPYYNNIPGKMPPPGGFIDARLTNQNAATDGILQLNQDCLKLDFTHSPVMQVHERRRGSPILFCSEG